MEHIDIGETGEQGWRDVGVSKHEWQRVVSVVLVTIGRGVVAAGPHSSAAVGLSLKTLCAFTFGRYLQCYITRPAQVKLGMAMNDWGHVAAAVSCCFGDGTVDHTLDS